MARLLLECLTIKDWNSDFSLAIWYDAAMDDKNIILESLNQKQFNSSYNAI